VALLVVLAGMTGAPGRSAFVAAIFALHPAHVESVAWASATKDVVSGLFWVLAMGAYARYVARPTWPRYGVVALALALGLMSKPVVVTLPVVLLLLDLWPLDRAHAMKPAAARRLALEKAPLLIVGAAGALVSFAAQRSAGAVLALDTVGAGARIWHAPVAYVAYMKQAVWPSGLAVYYPHPGDAVSPLAGLAAAAAIVFASIVAWRARHRHAYATVGWFWFLITLLPVIGLVQVGQQAMADRYTYLPFIGLAIVVAWGVPDAVARAWPAAVVRERTLAAIGAGCAVALALLTARQAALWRDSITLFEHTSAVTRDNALARINLGVAYLNGGDLDVAERHLREALRIHAGAAEAHLALGTLLARSGRTDEAVERFGSALELAPESGRVQLGVARFLIEQGDGADALPHLREAEKLMPGRTDIQLDVAVALTQQGRFKEAIDLFRALEASAPDDPRLHTNWGVALMNLGRHEEAIERFRRALEYREASFEAHFGWGLAALTLGDMDEAVRRFTRAVAIRPSDAEAHHDLGLALAGVGRIEEATGHLLTSVGLAPGNPAAHNNLGIAFARQGRLDEAQKAFEAALAIAPDHRDARQNLDRLRTLIGR
jgi:Flp pilus assembly protein TadD